MKVSELGEFGLIDKVASLIYQGQQQAEVPSIKPLVGIGDDAAAFKVKGGIQLATSDCFVEGVHFTRDIAPWHAVGYRALAAALSDIAAMGGKPLYALTSLALPEDTEVDSVVELYKGMVEVAGKYGVTLAGGDMSQAPVVILDIAAIGQASANKVLTRGAAKPGHKIAVTGWLGGSAAGLKMLKEGLDFDAETEISLKKAFLYPQPRLAEGQLLVKYGAAAAIDISDGLLADLGHILKASQVSARLEAARIPVHPAVKAAFPELATELALGGGEDYELLFTASETAINKIKAQAAIPVTVIGEITEGKAGDISLVDASGNPLISPEAGWEHFARQ